MEIAGHASAPPENFPRNCDASAEKVRLPIEDEGGALIRLLGCRLSMVNLEDFDRLNGQVRLVRQQLLAIGPGAIRERSVEVCGSTRVAIYTRSKQARESVREGVKYDETVR
jgi:hypothetical protein